MITRKIKKNNGFVILFAVTLASILLAIAVGVANIAQKEINFGTSGKDTSYAFAAADTGAECALFYDKLSGSSFPIAGPATPITCASVTTTPQFSGLVSGQSTYSFTIPNLSGTNGSCAKVSVLKNQNVSPTAVTITSTGYNIGDSLCASTNTNRVARELKVYSFQGTAPPPTPAVTLTPVSQSGTVNIINPTLTWSATNSPTSCTASGDWSGSRAIGGGSQSQGVLSQVKTYSYTLTCYNGSGSGSATATVVVSTAPVPVISSFTASPSSGNVGMSTTLSWTVTNSPTSCTGGGDWSGSETPASGGSQLQGPLNTIKTYVFTLQCTNASGSSSVASANVTVSSGNPSATCTGGCSTAQVGSYRVHTFTSSGTLSVSVGGNMDYLVVGGGGGGGGGENADGGDRGGGGGGGGFRAGLLSIFGPQDYVITVGTGGSGGAGATSSTAAGFGVVGGNSIFSTITSLGGGRGGREEGNGGTGGSGGGAGGSCSGQRVGGTGTSGQGNNGGTTNDSGCNDHRNGSGGGGAGTAGGDNGFGVPGNGGNGLSNIITGLFYSGGGGGGSNTGTGGTGGSGGGGAGGANVGSPGVVGTTNRGGGGGGGSSQDNVGAAGGAGGSGIVIIRYLYP